MKLCQSKPGTLMSCAGQEIIGLSTCAEKLFQCICFVHYYYIIIEKSSGTATRTFTSTEMKMEDNRRVCSCPQSTTCELLAMNMTQQIEMRTIGKATEMTRRILLRPTYTPSN